MYNRCKTSVQQASRALANLSERCEPNNCVLRLSNDFLYDCFRSKFFILIGRSRSAEIPNCLITYVHNFFETIENETKIKGTKKILPKIYCIEKKKVRMLKIKENICTE